MEILKKSWDSISITTPTPTPPTTSPNHSYSHPEPEDEHSSLLDQTQTHICNSCFSDSEFIMSGPVGGDASNTNDVIIKINTRANDPTPSSSQLKTHNDENKHAAANANANANANAKHSDIWKGSSYDFSSDIAMAAFANKSKDFDFATESPLSQQRSPLARIPEAGPTSDFEKVTADQVRRRSNASGSPGRNGSPDEILICSGNSSFKRRSSLLRTKTKSRLLDPPELDRKTSRLLKSGVMSRAGGGGGGGGEVEEEDPFFDEDLPEEYNTMRFSVWTVVEILSLVSLVAALIGTVTIKKWRRKTLFQLELWKWEVMILVLICGRLFSGWGIRIVVLLVERNFLLRKRVLYFVYGLRKAVQNCIWLTLVFVAWQSIFDDKLLKVTHGKVLPYVTKIWICLLVATLIWLVKTLIVKVLASSFHVSTFFDRIQESLFNQYVVEALSGPPLVEILQEQEEEERVIAEVQKLQNAGAKLPADLKGSVLKSGRLIGTPRKSPLSNDGKTPRFSKLLSRKEEEKGITIDHLHRLNQKNISAWNMKRLMNIVRKGALSTLDERLEDCNDDEASVEITSEIQAKMAAKKIFYNVAKPGSKVIQAEDLMRFMREDEALKTMHLFEGANEGKGISKKSLKNWVVNAFRERRALALSLNDTKTAVNKLHQMLNVVVAIIVVVIWLLILKLASTHFFIFISSQLLLVVFMFGNTCKTTFEAIIFLFVMHPFDVGDRVEIDEVQMVVEEINILTTVFLRYDNQKIFYPNSVLATKPISNYYRSPDMGDAIDFCIHISTPMEKIALMKERITRAVENRSDHWYPSPMVVMRDVEDMNKLKWSVWLSHTINFQDMGERWSRRALLVEEMIKAFKELDIEYRMLPHDVNVRSMPAVTTTRTPSNWAVCS